MNNTLNKNKTGKFVLVSAVIMAVLLAVTGFTGTVYGYNFDNPFKPGDVITANYSDETPVLDGNAESLWEDAGWIEINEVMNTETSGATGKMKLMWNESFLFLYAEITDEKVCSADSIGKDNDCMEFMFLENPGSWAYEENTEESVRNNAKPEEGNLVFLLYNAYKPENFGETINSNLRDYVAAECRKTDGGYNLEAIIKLSRKAVVGDKFLFGSTIYSIEEENGNAVNETKISSEGLSELYFTDTNLEINEDLQKFSVLSVDMSYDFTESRLEEIENLCDPMVICVQKTDESNIDMLKRVFSHYYLVQYDDSDVIMFYDDYYVTLTESGRAGTKGDCVWGFFKDKDGADSFYVYGMWLDDFGGAVRRAQASEIMSEINSKNRFGYPVIVCGNINSRENSFTYDIFGVNQYDDVRKVTDDYTAEDDESTVYMFLDGEKFSVKMCRLFGTDGKIADENTGAVFVQVYPDGEADSSFAERKTVFYIIEGILTVGIGAAVALYLFRKSGKKAGKEKKC